MTDINLFDDNTPVIDPNKDYRSELVGEGKKYKDEAALARAAVEKDAFIDQLKKELKEVREDLSTRTKMQEFLDRMEQQRTPPQPVEERNHPDPSLDNGINPEDLERLVAEQIARREADNQRNRNLIEVKEKLVAAFGENYSSIVKAKAQEIGVTVEFLNDVAVKSPKAFLDLVGAKPAAPVAPDARSSFNTQALAKAQVAGEKNWAYYSKMRRERPTEYHSPQVQQEIWTQAKRLGEAFYS